MKFFTADHHFNHKGILHLDTRDFKNVWNMNQHMINMWNDTVGKGDIVYHLGDFAMPNKGDGMEFPEVVDKLNGQIFWILGNHDDKNREIADYKQFIKITHLHYMKILDRQKVMLCHYPMLTWRASVHGSWHLHGHCHGNLPPMDGLRLDVGVDTNNFIPYSEHDIANVMAKKIQSLIDCKEFEENT